MCAKATAIPHTSKQARKQANEQINKQETITHETELNCKYKTQHRNIDTKTNINYKTKLNLK